MVGGHYILAGTEPVVADLMTWARWFETADRQVALTDITEGIQVSTVFLGLDHNFSRQGAPLLFETMVFGGALNDEQERYATWHDAEQGHEAMVQRVRATLEVTP